MSRKQRRLHKARRHIRTFWRAWHRANSAVIDKYLYEMAAYGIAGIKVKDDGNLENL